MDIETQCQHLYPNPFMVYRYMNYNACIYGIQLCGPCVCPYVYNYFIIKFLSGGDEKAPSEVALFPAFPFSQCLITCSMQNRGGKIGGGQPQSIPLLLGH